MTDLTEKRNQVETPTDAVESMIARISDGHGSGLVHLTRHENVKKGHVESSQPL